MAKSTHLEFTFKKMEPKCTAVLSEVWSLTGSIGRTWVPIRNAESRAPPQTYGIRICHLPRSPVSLPNAAAENLLVTNKQQSPKLLAFKFKLLKIKI